MEQINDFLSSASGLLWGWPMIILLLGTHIFLTIRLRFPQRNLFTAIRLSVKSDKKSTGDVSQFGALATALAATIGTGNIVGVATAVALGGPGAVLWCWLTGVFGIATKYGEGLLAIKYRVKSADGHMMGGPMYALERGLGMKWLAVCFAVFTAVASFGIGNSVQANAIATLGSDTFGINPAVTGVVVSLVTAAVILGGVKSIARVCSMLVPVMAMSYIIGCCYILVLNSEYLWPAIRIIAESAFSPEAAGGGLAGSGIMIAARFGIARGLFSNESGLGSAPIVAAAAQTRNPVRQALVSSSGTFWDTVIICALTGLVIVSSILAYPEIDYKNGAVLTHAAFSKIPVIGAPLLSFGLLTFAFTTILGWSYYGEKAIEYLVKGKQASPTQSSQGEQKGLSPSAETPLHHHHFSIIVYRILYSIATFVGCTANLAVVWSLADCMNALMAIPNLISLLLLNGVIVAETRKYLWSGRLLESDDEDDEEALPD